MAGPLRWGSQRALGLRECHDADLLTCLTSGFSLGTAGAPLSNPSPRHRIPANKRADVSQLIADEVASGFLAGPFSSPPFPTFLLHSLCVVPKALNKIRLIHNYSVPAGAAVNEFIPDNYARVVYPSVETAVGILRDMSEFSNIFLFKEDVANAYRVIPLNPSDYPKTVFRWENQYFYDRALPMGCRSSCKSFQRVSNALVECVLPKMPQGIGCVNLLDDFLFICPSLSAAEEGKRVFSDFCKRIAFPLNPDKAVGPSRSVVFLGILFDLDEATLTLQAERVAELRGLVQSFRRRKKCLAGDLSSLLGKLNFACGVVRQGRTFLRRLYDVLGDKARFPHWHVDLNADARADISMWISFFDAAPGCVSRPIFCPQVTVHFETDAAGGDDSESSGFGILHQSWFSFGFFTGPSALGIICVKELFAVFLCLLVWPTVMENSRVVFHCDNQAVIGMLRSGTSTNRQCMHMLRHLVLFAMSHNVYFEAVYVRSEDNIICDLLSRNRISEALMHAHSVGRCLERDPVPLPINGSPSLWRIGKN